jgi:HTH-type transcriptional regulator/antitoxin HipB
LLCITAGSGTEAKVNYPIKTLGQLPLVLKGFRKLRGLTQAAVAERLGITQQSYAYFEANPATATLERLFTVLRLLDVEISLDQAASTGMPEKRSPAAKTAGKATRKAAPVASIRKAAAPTVRSPVRVIAAARKKEAW